MIVSQGEVWWADLAEPRGSEPGYRRPLLVVQCDSFNRSKIATAVCVPLTSNLKWEDVPGNVRLKARETGLPRDSVANASQILTVDQLDLDECIGRIPGRKLDLVFAGIDVVLGR